MKYLSSTSKLTAQILCPLRWFLINMINWFQFVFHLGFFVELWQLTALALHAGEKPAKITEITQHIFWPNVWDLQMDARATHMETRFGKPFQIAIVTNGQTVCVVLFFFSRNMPTHMSNSNSACERIRCYIDTWLWIILHIWSAFVVCVFFSSPQWIYLKIDLHWNLQ